MAQEFPYWELVVVEMGVDCHAQRMRSRAGLAQRHCYRNQANRRPERVPRPAGLYL